MQAGKIHTCLHLFVLGGIAMTDPELLSLSEAARRYAVPMGTIRDALYRGDIVGRKIGSQWVVEARSVEAFLANRPRRGRPTRSKD
jgi:hypothetical protein